MKKITIGFVLGALLFSSVPVLAEGGKSLAQRVTNLRGRMNTQEIYAEYLFEWLEAECTARGMSVEDCRPETDRIKVNKRFK